MIIYSILLFLIVNGLTIIFILFCYWLLYKLVLPKTILWKFFSEEEPKDKKTEYKKI